MRDRHYKLAPEPLSEEARRVITGEDVTENCSIDDWYQCQRTPCRYHGTCHTEAMLQPEPDSEDDYSKMEV